MASEDAERRGRRRWFRILGSADADRPEGAMQEEPMAGNDLGTAETDVAADAVPEVVGADEADGRGRAGGASRGGISGGRARGTGRRSRHRAHDRGGRPAEFYARRPGDLGPAPDPITLPRVLAIANQKGGVGKTTTAVNLGAALADLGFRVLVVDLDPQGNATTGLGISHRNVEGTIYDVIMNDTPVEDCVEPTTVRNLFVVPATIDLAGAEIELVPAFSRELKLRRALQASREEYDFIMIDCPPSLGLLTVNGLAAADDVLVPIQCEYYALEGLGQLLRNVALGAIQPQSDARCPGHGTDDVRRPDEAVRPGRAGSPRPLRPEGVPHRRAPHGPHLRGALLRAARDRLRCFLAGGGCLPRARQGGEPWRVPADWVRGSVLSSPPGQVEAGALLQELPVSVITANPAQPREHFDEESMGALAESIREVGVLQPVLVREHGDGYELIAGERRWRAARRVGLQTIPAIVRHADDAAVLQQAIIENVQREQLNPLEEAAAYQQLIEDFSLTHDDVATRVGKSRATVTNMLRLLQLPPSIQRYVKDGSLRMGHARALLGTPDRAFQEQLARKAVNDDLTVREVEEAIRARSDSPPQPEGRRRRRSPSCARRACWNSRNCSATTSRPGFRSRWDRSTAGSRSSSRPSRTSSGSTG